MAYYTSFKCCRFVVSCLLASVLMDLPKFVTYVFSSKFIQKIVRKGKKEQSERKKKQHSEQQGKKAAIIKLCRN